MRKNDIDRIVLGLFMSGCCLGLFLYPPLIFAADTPTKVFSISAEPIRVYPPEDPAEPEAPLANVILSAADKASTRLTTEGEAVSAEAAPANSQAVTGEGEEAKAPVSVGGSVLASGGSSDTAVSADEYSTAELLRSLKNEAAPQKDAEAARGTIATALPPAGTSSGNPSEDIQPVETTDGDFLDVEARIDKAIAAARTAMASQQGDVTSEKTAEAASQGETPEQQDLVQAMDQSNEEILTGLIKPELAEKRIDLDFDQVTLGEIFLSLGKICDINVVLDPQVKAIPSDLHLNQVLIREAFLLIGYSHNLVFRRVENSLFVISKDKVKEQSLTSKIFKLKNIRAADAKAMLAELVKTINVSEEINSIMVIGTREQIAKAEKTINAIDKAQPQVLLEAQILEINKDALKELGVDWSDDVTLNVLEAARPVEMPDVANPSASPFRINGFERSPILLSQVIHMLENQNKAKLLSNPRVMTINNKQAEIFVGDRLPYTITSTSTGVATTEVRYEEPGIRLKITPSIIENDFVVIRVEPEVSYIYGFRGPSDEYPWTKKRYALAYVRVKDGQAFAIGGLLNQEDKHNLYKVPMLGKLPLIGNLFEYNKHTVTDTELIIIICPTILNPEKK